MDKVTVANLQVVDFDLPSEPHDLPLSDIKKWGRRSPAVSLLNCARRFWIGAEGDFDGFPFQAIPSAGAYSGMEAYARLVLFGAGVIGADRVDNHNRSIFETHLERINKGSKSSAARFVDLLELVQKDIKFSGRAGLNDYRVINPANIAFKLSDIQKGDSVVFVPFVNLEGQLCRESKKLLNMLATRNNRHAGTIIATHPDPDVLQITRDQMDAFEADEKHKVLASFRVEPWENISDVVRKSNRLISTSPRYLEKRIDRDLLGAWGAKRGRQNSSFVNMRDLDTDESGDHAQDEKGPKPNVLSHAMRLSTLHNYVSASHVAVARAKQVQKNREAISRATLQVHDRALQRLHQSLDSAGAVVSMDGGPA